MKLFPGCVVVPLVDQLEHLTTDLEPVRILERDIRRPTGGITHLVEQRIGFLLSDPDGVVRELVRRADVVTVIVRIDDMGDGLVGDVANGPGDQWSQCWRRIDGDDLVVTDHERALIAAVGYPVDPALDLLDEVATRRDLGSDGRRRYRRYFDRGAGLMLCHIGS